MDANTLTTVIGSLGFPIVACLGIAWFFAKVNDNYRSDIKEMNASHKAEIDKMTEAINNNTIVIQKLIDRMEDNSNE